MVSQASCLTAEWEQQLEARRHIYTSTQFCLQWNEGQSGLPGLRLVDCLADPNACPSEIQFPPQFPQNIVKLEILFHSFLSCLKSVCPSSLPHDQSVAEIQKHVFFYSFVILNIHFDWYRNSTSQAVYQALSPMLPLRWFLYSYSNNDASTE